MSNKPDRVDGVGDEGQAIDPYLWDGSGEPDPAVARLEKVLSGERWVDGRAPALRESAGPAVAPARAVAPRWRMGWRSGLALAATMAIVAGGAWVWLGRVADTGWRVEPVAGTPGLGDRTVASVSALPAGEWLRTDSNSRARLRGEGVGTVDVEPGSDVRLLRASKDEHRLELARGSISAFVTTPPKVFFVNTPAATAVDMGCAYRLSVDEAGEGTLYVTLGWVELHEGGREVRVPAGAACHIGGKKGPGPGPGTPWFEDAEPEFRGAVGRVDVGGAGLEAVLAGARARDSLTLWHLAGRLDGADRARVAARLAELVPPPEGVVIGALDAAGLERWWGPVRASW